MTEDINVALEDCNKLLKVIDDELSKDKKFLEDDEDYDRREREEEEE